MWNYIPEDPGRVRHPMDSVNLSHPPPEEGTNSNNATTQKKNEDSGNAQQSSPAADAGGAVVEHPKWTRLPLRTRPHRNPLAENDDEHPICPEEVTTRFFNGEFYPKGFLATIGDNTSRCIEFVDVGCAFGGMLCSLCRYYPDSMMLGLEIRSKVVAFSQQKVLELRKNSDHVRQHHYNNVWFEQNNVMKFGNKWFRKGQLRRLFFCYPDPHWKKKNIRRRIINPQLAQEYAHWLAPGGMIYTVSDVKELEDWMIESLDACPLFKRLDEEDIRHFDEELTILDIITSSSEDAQRTERKGLTKNYAVHIRVSDPPHNGAVDVDF